MARAAAGAGAAGVADRLLAVRSSADRGTYVTFTYSLANARVHAPSAPVGSELAALGKANLSKVALSIAISARVVCPGSLRIPSLSCGDDRFG
jgi:hypothetical protein